MKEYREMKLNEEEEEEFRELLEKRITISEEEMKSLRKSEDILFNAIYTHNCKVIVAKIETVRNLRNGKKSKIIEREIENMEKDIFRCYIEYS